MGVGVSMWWWRDAVDEVWADVRRGGEGKRGKDPYVTNSANGVPIGDYHRYYL